MGLWVRGVAVGGDADGRGVKEEAEEEVGVKRRSLKMEGRKCMSWSNQHVIMSLNSKFPFGKICQFVIFENNYLLAEWRYGHPQTEKGRQQHHGLISLLQSSGSSRQQTIRK